MSLMSIYLSGCEYSSRMIEVGKSEKDEETRGEKREREQDQEETTGKRTLVLGLAADNDVRTKIIKKNKEKEKDSEETKREGQTESEYRSTKVVHTLSSMQIQSLAESEDCKEVDDDDDDDDVSWPQFFADQLIKTNEQQLLQQEQDIPMLPNTFFKDLLEL